VTKIKVENLKGKCGVSREHNH